MRRPIRIRTFILLTVLVLLLLPALAGGAAWLVERDHQQADLQKRLNVAAAYLASHRTEIQGSGTVHGFSRLLDRLDLLAQVTLVTHTPPGKTPLYLSAALAQGQALQVKTRLSSKAAPAPTAPTKEAGSGKRETPCERMQRAASPRTPAKFSRL